GARLRRNNPWPGWSRSSTSCFHKGASVRARNKSGHGYRRDWGKPMTTSRRELLGQVAGAMAGIAFTSCGLGHAAHAQAQAPQPRRQPLVINGKRARTIDIHAHCHIPEALALMGAKQNTPALVITQDRIKVMDEQGIDVEALSINPNFWDQAERDQAAAVVKLQNEKLAEICAKTPDRFVGLASVSLAYPDLAAEQLDTAIKKLGLRGALV